ncbi:hypothetical protein GO984_02065 [Rhodobacteraceae bacterium CY05]|uniref:Uncharacterized protein n=1 Tax=Parasedimentitalea huanghaiensis TaxID=2682100 RepID=A0A6L6W9U9_9RHOB|nr:hypothetical protein [Zongyanglinia huanghaiensis]
MTLLSQLISDNPSIDSFWSLERCVSVAARSEPHGPRSPLMFDVEPEFRSTPRKWDLILTAAYERGMRAR